MKKAIISADKVLGKCAWCGKKIESNMPVLGFGAKKRPGIDISELEGHGIRMTLAREKRDLLALVPPENSDARKDGYDFMFMACSEECGRSMKSELEAEIQLGNAMFSAINAMRN